MASTDTAPAMPLPVLDKEAFDFSNVNRNNILTDRGIATPRFMKTGTTIVGCVYKDGVVLGADTRATEGSIVCDKNCEKIHRISKQIWCCGAGTAADTENVTAMVESQLELHRLSTGKEPRVAVALTRLKNYLFQYQGYVSAALILGGIDPTGSYLYQVYPHGSVDFLPFTTMGSGSLAAMAVFEHKYRDNMEEKEAIELVSQAVQAGIFNDLGSGSNVDIRVISRTTGVQYHRNFLKPNERLYKRQINKPGYNFPIGTTEWLKDTQKFIKSNIVVTDISEKKEEKKEMEI